MAKRKPRETGQARMQITPSFNDHQIIKSFMKTGMKEELAELIVEAIRQGRDADLSKLATKEQLSQVKEQLIQFKKDLELQIAKLEQDTNSRFAKLEQDIALLQQQVNNIEKTIATKDDLTRIEVMISRQESTLIKWMLGTVIAGAGTVVAGIGAVMTILKFIN